MGRTEKLRRVHGEATRCVVLIGRQRNTSCSSGANRLGQNSRNEAGIPHNGGNRLVSDHVWSKWGPIDREGCGVPQNGGNGLVLERLRLKRGPVDWEGCGVPQNGTPWATVHPPSTSSSLHLLLFIHRRLPPASTSYCSSTGSCSSSLHRLLFNQPSTESDAC